MGSDSGHDEQGADFRIYSRVDCHLCEVMASELRALITGTGRTLAIIDVDSEPELQDRFGEWVPVLMAGDRELCHYHLNIDRVRDYLEQLG